ncbi:Alpha/Beta hydrolase protein, partial [Lipomyces japonicus]|uniref:Alpha/Beta hydrolase protein n=1 Tax=Lipomyces japonicus TaxID=56871 RepID=UPI0034CF6BC1
MSTFTVTSKIATFGGTLLKLTHQSAVLSNEAAVNVFFPPGAYDNESSSSSEQVKVPVLFHLAGLTCTPDNGAEKGFFNYWAAKYGIAVVYPDTSARGSNHPGEHDAYDFGSAAGFYLDATAEPWSKNYKMESYVTEELPTSLFSFFPTLDGSRVSLTGHSMGGHGALSLFLKHPDKYKSTSAFAPIANPSNSAWGQKAFAGYLKDKTEWSQHDSTELLKAYDAGRPSLDILITVGLADNFYQAGQLLIENFEAAAKEVGREHEIKVNKVAGYDHGYYFVSSFSEDHVKHAAKHLGVL